jgi:dimethylamine corrinoid protein
MADLLGENLGDLNENRVYEQVKQQLAEGISPDKVFAELQKGMGIVGERYQKQEYYLSELIMAAEIFKCAAALLTERIATGDEDKIATMVLGTVAGDIHDIGKNIASLVFNSNGFKVIDLGVDVPIEKFVEAVREHNPQLIGLSCLLTTSFDSMKTTIEAIEAAGLRDGKHILVGGGPINEETCQYVNADGFCRDAPTGVAMAKKMLGVN